MEESQSSYISDLGFPTCVNGALHWICFDGEKGSILYFQFESETFHYFFLPGLLEDEINDTKNITMGELEGSLYICDSSCLDTPVRMWIMEEYGDEESWTKVFSINTMNRFGWPYGGLYWPVKHFKSNDAILMYHSSNCFIYYEITKLRFKCFKIHGTQCKLEAISHTPSLISLKDLVNGGNLKVMNIDSR